MPVVDLNLCMKCFACIPACPNNAISETPKGPKFDSKKCDKSCRSGGKLFEPKAQKLRVRNNERDDLNPKIIANDSKCRICAEICPASAIKV